MRLRVSNRMGTEQPLVSRLHGERIDGDVDVERCGCAAWR